MELEPYALSTKRRAELLSKVIVALTIRNGIIMADELGPMAKPLPVIIIWALFSAWLLYAGP